MKTATKTRWDKYIQPDGTWDVNAMSHADLDALADDCAKMKPGSGRPLNRKERVEFEQWRKRSLAAKGAARKPANVKLAFPPELFARIGEIAKAKRTTPIRLIQRMVEDAVHHTVA